MHSTIGVIFCLIVGAVIPWSNASADIPSNVPAGYTYLPEFQSSYKLYQPQRDFEDSVLRCQWDGAAMFHPRSQQEIDAVFSMLANAAGNNATDPIFIGVHDWMGTRVLRSVDGEPIFNSTLTAAPPSGAPYTFVGMYKNGAVVTLQGIGYRYWAVCRVMHVKVCRESNIETDGYTLLRNFNASYKYYPALPIYRSNLRCLTDGAQQFTPDSREESVEIFRTIAARYPMISLGIHNYFSLGSFKTVNGQDFYSNWLQGHPLNIARDAIMRNDTVFVSNTGGQGFICKRRMVNCSIPNVPPPTPSIPTTTHVYASNTGRIYRLFAEKKTFYEAVVSCKAQKATVAFPNNFYELNHVRESLTRTVNVSAFETWLGFYLPSGYGNFALSLEGKVLKNLPLSATNSSARQGCGVWASMHTVSVVACDQRNPFLCQYEDDQEFSEYPIVGKAFKFSPTPLQWHDAVEYCHDQDSILAMPDKSPERNLLTMLLRERGVDLMFVGFHSLLTNNPIVQIQGFKNISSDLSWNYTLSSENNFCGGMDKSGLIARINCNSEHFFFCEKLKKMKSENISSV